MKSIKKITLMLVALFTLGGVAMADEVKQERKKMDPKVHAEKMTERMAQEYGLNDTQKKQLLDLNQTVAEKIGNRPGHRHHGKKGRHGEMAKAGKGDKANKEQARTNRNERRNRAGAPKLSAEEREKRMQEMKKVREDYKAQLQKIMNTDQYQAFAKKEAERTQKMKERSEKRKENRGKKPASDKNKRQA